MNWLTWVTDAAGELVNSAVAFTSVRVIAMNSAAGTPLPDTSATAMPRRRSSIMK